MNTPGSLRGAIANDREVPAYRHAWHRPYRRASLVLFLAIAAGWWSLPARAADPATVAFSIDFPGSDPEHYSISVTSDGHARYECTAKISADSDDRETYQSEFNLSSATRARIFDLAAQARYFSGKVDSGNHKLAFTGAKKLVYSDGQRNNTAEYNFSSLQPIQQLTTLFQSVGGTLEFGRRLEHSHRYQKLALDEELKGMEEQIHHGDLAELQAVQPILQQIYDDTAVMNVVRARAHRIMEMGKNPPAAP